MNAILAVFVGGGLGSVARFLIGKLSAQYLNVQFPIGTLFSNLLSTGILAALVWLYSEKVSTDSIAFTFLIVGFCGGFSTFSTFSYETFLLMKSNHYWLAALNVLISIGAALTIIFLMLKNQ